MLSKDIAKLAGVSRSTVSRVVNNYPNVPDETRRAVEKVIEEYGYVPNAPARNLTGIPNKIFALFIVDLFSDENEDTVYESPTFSESVLYTIDRAQHQGYKVLVAIVNQESGFKPVHDLFKSSIISGAIIMGDQMPEDEIEFLEKSKFKVALFNQADSIKPETHSLVLVNSNNREPVFKAVEAFVRNGHTRIGHITGNSDKFAVRERLQSFKEKLELENIPFVPDYVAYSDFHKRIGGHQAMKEILKKNPEFPPTAIFVANSIMGFGAIDAMREHGLKPKDDISIIGYGSIYMVSQGPVFTTVDTPMKRAVDVMLSSLLEIVENKEAYGSVIRINEFSFFDRGSVRFVP